MKKSVVHPRVKRLIRMSQAGWKNGVWVGLGHLTPQQIADGDTTLPVITHSYSTAGALIRAIKSGDAFFEQDTREVDA